MCQHKASNNARIPQPLHCKPNNLRIEEMNTMNRILSVVMLGALMSPVFSVAQAADALSPKCAELTGSYPATGDYHAFAECWQELDDETGCYVYRGHYHSGDSIRGSGDCSGGIVKSGTLALYGGWGSSEGPYVDGKRNGHWVIRNTRGGVRKGPYVDGKRNGYWEQRSGSSGSFKGPYVDGKRNGHWVLTSRFGNKKDICFRAGKRVDCN